MRPNPDRTRSQVDPPPSWHRFGTAPRQPLRPARYSGRSRHGQGLREAPHYGHTGSTSERLPAPTPQASPSQYGARPRAGVGCNRRRRDRQRAAYGAESYESSSARIERRGSLIEPRPISPQRDGRRRICMSVGGAVDRNFRAPRAALAKQNAPRQSQDGDERKSP